MAPHAFDLDPHSLAITVRDLRLFDVAERVASSFGIGEVSRIAGRLSIRCANVEDLALLGQLLADRADCVGRGIRE